MMAHVREMGVWMPIVLKYFWYACWALITPGLLGTVTIMAWVYYEPDDFEGYVFPPGIQFMGWGLELFAVAVVLAFVIHTYVVRIMKGKSISFRVMFLEPTPLWGPRIEVKKVVKGKDNEGFEQDDQ